MIIHSSIYDMFDMHAVVVLLSDFSIFYTFVIQYLSFWLHISAYNYNCILKHCKYSNTVITF